MRIGLIAASAGMTGSGHQKHFYGLNVHVKRFHPEERSGMEALSMVFIRDLNIQALFKPESVLRNLPLQHSVP